MSGYGVWNTACGGFSYPFLSIYTDTQHTRANERMVYTEEKVQFNFLLGSNFESLFGGEGKNFITITIAYIDGKKKVALN